jgi:hypothetical protein
VGLAVVALPHLRGIAGATCGIGPAVVPGIGKFFLDGIHEGKGALTAVRMGESSDETAALYLFLESHRAGSGIGLVEPAFEKGKIGYRVSCRHAFSLFSYSIDKKFRKIEKNALQELWISLNRNRSCLRPLQQTDANALKSFRTRRNYEQDL